MMYSCMFLKLSLFLIIFGGSFLSQCAVLSVLGGLSAIGQVTRVTSDMLNNAKSQLKRLLVSTILNYICICLYN